MAAAFVDLRDELPASRSARHKVGLSITLKVGFEAPLFEFRIERSSDGIQDMMLVLLSAMNPCAGELGCPQVVIHAWRKKCAQVIEADGRLFFILLSSPGQELVFSFAKSVAVLELHKVSRPSAGDDHEAQQVVAPLGWRWHREELSELFLTEVVVLVFAIGVAPCNAQIGQWVMAHVSLLSSVRENHTQAIAVRVYRVST